MWEWKIVEIQDGESYTSTTWEKAECGVVHRLTVHESTRPLHTPYVDNCAKGDLQNGN